MGDLERLAGDPGEPIHLRAVALTALGKAARAGSTRARTSRRHAPDGRRVIIDAHSGGHYALHLTKGGPAGTS